MSADTYHANSLAAKHCKTILCPTVPRRFVPFGLEYLYKMPRYMARSSSHNWSERVPFNVQGPGTPLLQL